VADAVVPNPDLGTSSRRPQPAFAHAQTRLGPFQSALPRLAILPTANPLLDFGLCTSGGVDGADRSTNAATLKSPVPCIPTRSRSAYLLVNSKQDLVNSRLSEPTHIHLELG
jgi:hypothetical protein